jgi:hypothetical protein
MNRFIARLNVTLRCNSLSGRESAPGT